MSMTGAMIMSFTFVVVIVVVPVRVTVAVSRFMFMGDDMTMRLGGKVDRKPGEVGDQQ